MYADEITPNGTHDKAWWAGVLLWHKPLEKNQKLPAAARAYVNMHLQLARALAPSIAPPRREEAEQPRRWCEGDRSRPPNRIQWNASRRSRRNRRLSSARTVLPTVACHSSSDYVNFSLARRRFAVTYRCGKQSQIRSGVGCVLHPIPTASYLSMRIN